MTTDPTDLVAALENLQTASERVIGGANPGAFLPGQLRDWTKANHQAVAALADRDAGLQLANITHGMWSHAEEECDRLRGALGACERYALRITGEAKARGFSAANAEAIVRVCRENAPPACAYCGTTEGLRKAGERPPDFICEKCFTPTDTGPCFDDLEPAPATPVPAEGKKP